MTESSRDPHRLLSGLHRDRVSLELTTLDLCLLAALHLRADQDGLPSFDEELVFDVWDQISSLVEPGAEPSRKRATHTIQRLRSQRMLARVDATGIVTAGEYSLTSLGTVIVKSFLEEEELTRESLSLLTGAVIASLARIRTAAERAGEEAAWRSEVIAPLRVTVSDLVGGIERRQRGLDGQQEEVQRRIGELLQADWFGAVESCQALLEAMATTLQELNEVLLRDNSHIQALLQEVQQRAAAADAVEAEETAQRVGEQVDRIAAWGASRQEAWSGYYQYVHRFLRDVVRLDPDRALSQRLLDQVRSFPSGPFALVVASESQIRLLRSVSATGERPPVGRPSFDRERELTIVASDDGDTGPDLEELVQEALRDEPAALAVVAERVLTRIDEREHYRSAGRIAALVAKLTTPRSERERPWVAVSGEVEIEDWKLEAAREGRGR